MKDEFEVKINVDNTDIVETNELLSESVEKAEELSEALNIPRVKLNVNNNRNVYITINHFNSEEREER